MSIAILPVSTHADSRVKTLDHYFKQCERYYTFTGSVLVAEKGRVLYKKGLVCRNWPKKIPNTADTQFVIGSISKPFTAMLTLKLVEEGKLRLQGKVSDYLSYYPKDKGRRITIHQLLCHSAGFVDISRYYPDFFSKVMKKEYTNREFIELFCHLDLEFEPGTRYSYSSAGYYLLAAIIEKVTGKRFGQVLKEKIFSPLGMAHSGCLDYSKPGYKMAVGYDLYNFRYSKADYTSPTAHKGGGTVYSTVEDLFKWDRALKRGALLSNTSMDLMFSPHMDISGNVGYGYGWAVGKKYIGAAGKYVRFIEHGGLYNGFSANFSRLEDNDRVIILLSNATGTEVGAIRDQIINILYGKPYRFVIPITFALEEGKTVPQMRKIIAHFRSSRHKYSIKMDMLNGLGLTLLLEKDMDRAIEVLEFGAAEFPNSSMIFSSLGTVYLKAGKTKPAIKNLKRCLRLNPADLDAKQKLKQLGAL
jgi:CubicO group peptidase (beta-lactamase class C family)